MVRGVLFVDGGNGTAAHLMVGYLRFVLACLVAYSHFNFAPLAVVGVDINQGVAAVFAFYLLSGFFSAVILDRYSGENRLRNYYIDRLLRIFPLYIAVIALVGAIGLDRKRVVMGKSVYVRVVSGGRSIIK